MKLIPNKKYVEIESHSAFNFNINSVRRELDIYLFTGETKNIDKYPFQLFIKQNAKGELNFKINSHTTKKITDVIKFNSMMNLWSEEGLRRLRIHNTINNQTVTIVPDKIDTDKDNYAENLKKIIDKAELTIDEIPHIKSDELMNKIYDLNPDTMAQSDCLSLINEIKNNTHKDQTNILILLKNEDGKIIFSRRACILPYLINLDFLNLKPTNTNGINILKRAFNREVSIDLEKLISGTTLEDYFKELVAIFERDKFSFNMVLSKLFNNSGTTPIGKCWLKINELANNYWANEQTITFVIQYSDNEINNLIELNKLLSSENLINAIPLMQQYENNYLENLAFAFYLKKDYEMSLVYCNKAIDKNFHSVAHFTKGLVFLAEEKYTDAHTSYMNGIYLNKSTIWYPIIKDNIKLGIKNGQIIDNEKIKALLNDIELYSRRTHSKIIKNCFCGSKKSYFECHGKTYSL